MRLREVHAHGFGSLVDERLVLGPGVNVIAGPNESGKSTWQVAIATALTGLRKGRKTKADRAFAERYAPWVGDVFAVGAVVEVDSGVYRVHRDLARGVDAVFDEQTGQDVTSRFVVDGTCDLSRLVGLDRRTLPLAAMVRQGEILAVTQSAGDEADALRSFLQQAAASRSDADVTAELAIGRIDKFVKDSLGSDRRNSTKPLRTAIDAAQQARLHLDGATEAQATSARLRSELDQVERELADLRARTQQTELADAEAALGAQQAELAEAERLENQVAASAGDVHYLSATADPQELRRLAWELDQQVVTPDPSLEARRKSLAGELANQQQRERSLLGVAALGVGAVILAFVAGARSWLGTAGLVALCGAGLAILIGAAIGAQRGRRARSGAQQQEALVREELLRADAMRGEQDRRVESAAATATQLGFVADPHALTVAAQQIEDAEKDAAATRIEHAAAQAALDGLLRGRSVADLRSAVADRTAAVESLRASAAAMSPSGDGASGPDVGALRRSIEVAALRKEQLVANLAASTATVGDLTSLHEEHERAVQERDRLVKLRELTDRTRTYLDQARLEVHREIAPRLASVTEERLARVTAGRYKELRVDPEDLSVRLRSETGVWRSASSASLGTQEQVYLLLRAAIAELVAPDDEPSPLLLDEVTVHADNERLAALLDVVELLAETRQVIVFTQEDRVIDWARSAGHAVSLLARP